jgi:hypothetical protein
MNLRDLEDMTGGQLADLYRIALNEGDAVTVKRILEVQRRRYESRAAVRRNEDRRRGLNRWYGSK